MTHVQSLIRSEELRQFRDGPAPITLATYVPRCNDDRHDIAECVNAACRWSGVCNLDQSDRHDH